MKKCETKLNNKGFTLIELVVASMVSVIVLLVLVTFLTLALKEYRIVSVRTSMQQESQIVQGQMGGLIMEAVSIEESQESEGYEGYIIKTGAKQFKLVYDISNAKLLLADEIGTSAEDMSSRPEAYLMASNISRFSLSPSNLTCQDANASVSVKLSVEIDGEAMTTEDTFAMRNGVW